MPAGISKTTVNVLRKGRLVSQYQQTNRGPAPVATQWLRRTAARLSPGHGGGCWVSPSVFCGGQSGTVTRLLPSTAVFPCQYHSILISGGFSGIASAAPLHF